MQPSAKNTLSVESTPTILDVVDTGDLKDTSVLRLYKVLEYLNEGYTIKEIALKPDIGVHYSTIYRDLQRVDFQPIINLLVTDIYRDIQGVESPDRKAWLAIQFLGKIYSKKLKSESTVKIHSVEDKRNISLVLDKLDFETQRKIAQALQSDNGTIINGTNKEE